MADEIAILSHPVRHRCVTDDKMATEPLAHVNTYGQRVWNMDGQQFDSI